MECFLCGQKIGLLSSLIDRKYCSKAHRLEAERADSSPVREDDGSEPWSVEKARRKQAAAAEVRAKLRRAAALIGQGAAITVFGCSGVAMLGIVLFGNGGSPEDMKRQANRWVNSAEGAVGRAIGFSLTEWAGSLRPLKLHTTFADEGARAEWETQPIAKAALHLWKPTSMLRNYHFEFNGRLEKSSLAWAVRATDAAHFQAVKLAIVKASKKAPNAALIRYAVVDGVPQKSVEVPLPLTLVQGTTYHISVNLEGRRMVTYLNGRVISNAELPDLARGGVGFIDDPADPQHIESVALAEHDSLASRLAVFMPF
jgi:hypothetical protein